VVLVRVKEGGIQKHMKIRLGSNNEVYEVEELGTLTPKPVVLEELEAGDVGFVVANIKRVADARVGDTQHMKIRLGSNNEVYEVEELGTLTPKPVVLEELEAGDVGFVVANIKRVADARVGDTLIEADRPAPPLPGFEAIKPMV